MWFLLLLISSSEAIQVGAVSKTVHGVIGRDATLALLRRRSSLGRFKCNLLTQKSSVKAVVTACLALRKEDTFSILQLRPDGSTMFVCAARRNGEETTHRLVAVLSSTENTPFRAIKDALAWHKETFNDITVCT